MQDLLQAKNFAFCVYDQILKRFTSTFYRDSYRDAAYFTYNQGNTKCYCKEDHDVEQTRQKKGGRVSGNVKCDDSV